MSDDQCNHATWLEHMSPQFGDVPHWTLHRADGPAIPHEYVSEHIIFDYCPLCGTKLEHWVPKED